LYGLPSTGLRFFTVYGPWGRPDMAYYKFVKNIINCDYIDVFGNGKMYRDFTYIDDVVNVVLKLIPKIPQSNELSRLKNEIYNIGNNKPHSLEYFIEIIEAKLKIKAKKKYKDIQAGDVFSTAANNEKLKK
jgi:UDP-glucuronate 4-epimerase